MAKAKPQNTTSAQAIDRDQVADAAAARLGLSPLAMRSRFAAMSTDQLAQISDAIDAGADYSTLIDLAAITPPNDPAE